MMKKSKERDLYTPARQPFAAITIILLESLKRLVRVFWPALILLLLNRNQNSSDFWVNLTLGLSGITVIGSIVSYFRYYYYVTDKDLIIEQGLLNKKKINIPFGRIQAINFEQEILHQLFDVVRVKIDTAGSVSHEATINALEKPVAEQLKTFLLKQKKHAAPQTSDEAPHPIEPERVLVRLTLVDLFKVGVSQNHLRTAGIIFAFLVGFLDDIEEILNLDIYDSIRDAVGAGISSYLVTFLLMIPVFLIISFLITLIRTTLFHYNQTVYKTPEGFKIQSGLFTRRSTFINFTKIQWLKWSQNPISRIFKLYEVRIKQASSKITTERKSSFIPGVDATELEAIRTNTFAPDLFSKEIHYGIDPRIISRYTLYIGIIPGLIIAILLFLQIKIYAVLGIVWVLLVYLLSKKFQRTYNIWINPAAINLEFGVWERTNEILPAHKVQAVTIVQSPYQRRHQLATLRVSSAAGNLSIPYISLELSQQLSNYLLFKVETHQGHWM